MKLERARRQYQPSLDITSLIDVVFLLLVFLLVTMTFDQNKQNAKEEAIVDIELAKASSITQKKPTQTRAILVDEGGKAYLEADPTPYNPLELKLKIGEKLIEDPNIAVSVRADHRARHGEIVAVLDLLKSLHIERVNLVIELTKEE